MVRKQIARINTIMNLKIIKEIGMPKRILRGIVVSDKQIKQ